jgi:Tfp pilus assembly protein PilN
MDLIPQDYRDHLRISRVVKHFTVSAVGLLLLSGLLYAVLEVAIAEDRRAIQVLEKKKAITSQQRLVLESLQDQQKSVADRLAVLERLRGGAVAQDMFIAVDRALDGDSVWFTSWSFLRAGSAAPREPQTVNTGYFIVIPQGQGTDPQPAWQIKTHMEIKGQARDHAALSEFVGRFLDQSQIADVRVLNTRQHKYGQATVIDFELAVVVNSNRAGA